MVVATWSLALQFLDASLLLMHRGSPGLSGESTDVSHFSLFWSKLYLEIGAYCLALSLLDALLPIQDDSSLLIFDPDPP